MIFVAIIALLSHFSGGVFNVDGCAAYVEFMAS